MVYVSIMAKHFISTHVTHAKLLYNLLCLFPEFNLIKKNHLLIKDTLISYLHQLANVQLQPSPQNINKHQRRSLSPSAIQPEDSFHFARRRGRRGSGCAPSCRRSGRPERAAGCGARLWFAEGECLGWVAGWFPRWPETERSSQGRRAWTSGRTASRPLLWWCTGGRPAFWPCSPPPALAARLGDSSREKRVQF